VRSLRAVLAFYIFAWVNIVVPWHTRGIVSLPGTDSAKRQAPQIARKTCCGTVPPADSRSDPLPKRSKNCAVCHIAATYCPAVYVDASMAFARLMEGSPQPECRAAPSLEPLSPFWPTGPPRLTA